MAKQTPKTADKKTPTTPAVPVVPAVSAEKDSAIDARLAIPLDKDGEVLLDNMRDTTRAKLRALLTDAKLAKSLGIGASESTASAMALPAEMMYPLISGLSIIETLIIARATNAPREMVERIAPYSREETQQLAPILATVLSKHAGGLLNKWGDETALAFLLVSMTTAKIGAIRGELERLGPTRVVPFVPPVTDAPTDPEEK